MGRGPRAMGVRRRGSKAGSAAAAAVASRLADLSVPCAALSCAAVCHDSPASYAGAAGKGSQAASASGAGDYCLPGLSAPGVLGSQSALASEEGKILKHESEEEGKIRKLASLKLGKAFEDRILMPDSEEHRDILMKVKSEEGKILKLKKDFVEASEKELARIKSYSDPMPMVKPAAKMKTKKTVVVKTLVPLEHITFFKAMPCPVTDPAFNFYSEDELAYEPQWFQDSYRERKIVDMKMHDYHQALLDQYDKFGFAVDEDELTVDEDEDEENAVKN